MMTRPTVPIIASRWRRKRCRAYDHWLRALSSRPSAPVVSWGRTAGIPSTNGTGSRLTGVVGSVIADPWVEEAVEDVGDQVEDDDRDRDDDQVPHDRVHVALAELVDEVVAHPVEGEDRLGD